MKVNIFSGYQSTNRENSSLEKPSSNSYQWADQLIDVSQWNISYVVKCYSENHIICS